MSQVADELSKVTTWKVGDDTTDGKILEIIDNVNNESYAITDKPSDWQKRNGMTTGWNWLSQLESANK